MPIYEYECAACGQTSEVIQMMSATGLEKCPLCGQGPMRRLISRSGFVLKGGGFYTNEYPSASRKAGMSETKAGATANKPAEKETSAAKPEKSETAKPATEAKASKTK